MSADFALNGPDHQLFGFFCAMHPGLKSIANLASYSPRRRGRPSTGHYGRSTDRIVSIDAVPPFLYMTILLGGLQPLQPSSVAIVRGCCNYTMGTAAGGGACRPLFLQRLLHELQPIGQSPVPNHSFA